MRPQITWLHPSSELSPWSSSPCLLCSGLAGSLVSIERGPLLLTCYGLASDILSQLFAGLATFHVIKCHLIGQASPDHLAKVAPTPARRDHIIFFCFLDGTYHLLIAFQFVLPSVSSCECEHQEGRDPVLDRQTLANSGVSRCLLSW